MRLKSKILDLDIENRPLSYLGQDYTTAEITAIAACWLGERRSMRCWLLGREHPAEMLHSFCLMYDEAEIVTGHYIRMHDLPIINGALMERGLSPLGEKLVWDTKLDLIKKGPAFSASQENLCAMLGLAKPKVYMNTVMWREANRLTPEGLKLTEKRATGDVIQHMELLVELVDRDLLGPPKVWRP